MHEHFVRMYICMYGCVREVFFERVCVGVCVTLSPLELEEDIPM